MTWYYERVRWAVMVEGRGLHQWKESMITFRAGDRKAAFERALELGRRSQPFEENHKGRGTRGGPKSSSWMSFPTAKRSNWAQRKPARRSALSTNSSRNDPNRGRRFEYALHAGPSS